MDILRHSVCLLLLCLSQLAMASAVQQITVDDQKNIFLTIYERDLALVKDVRDVFLNNGSVKLRFTGVSERIQPETVMLFNQGKSRIKVTQLYFDNNLLTPQKLLQSYVGKSVRIIRTNPANGIENEETAQVLSAQDGIVLKIGDRIETTIPGRLVFDRIPANLQSQPTLTVELQSQTSRNQRLELDYLSNGLSWKTDYVAELNSGENKLDLSGWATIDNRSGADYQNAHVQLISGNPNITRPQAVMYAARSKAMLDAAQNSAIKEESFADYHLYTLPKAVTVANNQSSQLSLLTVNDVPVKKLWILNGSNYYYRSRLSDSTSSLPIGTYIEFKNLKSANLGIPLPKGIIRFYQKDSQSNLQFIGESQLVHTPVDGNVRLKLGESFDVTAQRKQTAFEQLPSNNPLLRIYENAYDIVIKNMKAESVIVQIREPIPGNWNILKENYPHTKDGMVAVWKIKVPANGQAILTYRVRVK